MSNYQKYISEHKAATDTINGRVQDMITAEEAKKACQIAEKELAQLLFNLSLDKAFELIEKIAHKEIEQ